MPQNCSDCLSSIGFLRRKCKCGLCRNIFCESCFSKTKMLTRQNMEAGPSQKNCLKCIVLSGSHFHREDLSLLNVKHLKEFLTLHSISTKNCTEKYHLVDLIMKFAEDCGQRSVTDLRFEAERQREVENMRREAERREAERREAERRAHEDLQRAASQSVDGLNRASCEKEFLHVKSPKRWKSVEELANAEDIQKLTISELKRILTTNFVDYRGCVEKRELVDKVKILWNEKKSFASREENTSEDSSYDKDLCKICMDGPIDCVLLDCGHLVTCVKCGKRLAECPICRQLVSKVVHVFRA